MPCFGRLFYVLKNVTAATTGWLRGLWRKLKRRLLPAQLGTIHMDDAAFSALVAEHSKAEPRSREGIMAVLALENVLKDEPEFAKPRMIVSGRGAHGWLPQFAAQKMISIVRNGRAPEELERAEAVLLAG